MNKAIFVTALAALIIQASPVRAEKLDPEWSEHREIADNLGLLAKQGDEDALKELKYISAAANWPAKHTLGWLFEVGFPGHPADNKKSCEYYGSAALFDYPPGMHAFAMCQFAQSSGRGSWDEYEGEAMNLLSGAARRGWTASAIYLSEYVFNGKNVSGASAFEIGRVVRDGLKTDPTLSQRTTLSYLLGMAAIYGAGEYNKVYRQGTYLEAEQALRDAVSYGHPAAELELPKIHSMWSKAVIEDAVAWKPPEESAQYCIDSVRSPDQKRWISEKCVTLFLESRNKLNYLQEYAQYLAEHLSEAERAEAVGAISQMKKASETFRAEMPLWEDQFLPAYQARADAGDWK